MEGEAQVETEAKVEPVVEVKTENKPDGFDKVEFTPEQLSRVNRIYGNMKRYENDARELREINQKLIETVKQVQEDQSKVVTHLQSKDFETAESRLRDEAKQAYARGDVDAFFNANSKISEIAAKKVLNEGSRQQPKPSQPQQQIVSPITPEDAINIALRDGSIEPIDANIYRAWVSETDQTGNVKRPWINPTDVRNSRAAVIGRSVFAEPAFENKPFAEKLREIDRRMGMNIQEAGQSVLGSGNLTRGQKTNKVDVNDYEARIAIRTKFGGSKAKSDSDHIEAWRQAKIKSQTKGSHR